MQCDKVIRELAVPTDDRDPASLAEHLAECPSCAVWADRAARFDRLWEATRPAEPNGVMWDTVWAHVAHAVDESTPAEQKAFTLHPSSLNGSAAKTEKSPAPKGRSSGFRAGRLMAIGSLGIAQAAAIFLAVSLSWQPPAKSPEPLVGDTSLAPSFVATDSKTTVSTNGVVEIEEGQQIVIRIEGPEARVVDLRPEGISYNIFSEPLYNDDWYELFNKMEAIASPPVVAMKE
jgi:hypothetical protein